MSEFNLEGIDKTRSAPDVLPEGTYLAEITCQERRSSKNGTDMLEIDWTIREGDHEGGLLRERFVLEGSETSTRINLGRLRRLSEAVGLGTRFDGRELVGKRCLIRVKLKVTEDYGEQNEIADHKTAAQKRRPAGPAVGQPAPAVESVRRSPPPQKPAAVAAAAATAAAAVADEDLPF
jgi:hypothetical protein